MNIFKKMFSSQPSNPGKFYDFTVKCKRCGEIIRGKVNVANEPSLEFDEKNMPYYVCRKVLIGNERCFERIEVVFKFNEARGLLNRQITGGEFVEN